MPRSKQSVDSKKKNKKHEEYEEEEQKKTKRNSRNKKKETESEEEDVLSDIDVEEDDMPAVESDENDNIVSHRKQVFHKEIDPNTPIGELRADDILSFLIEMGKRDLNPQLKFGALNLLKTLKGNKRHPNRHYGSKGPSNNYNHNNYIPNNRNNTRGNYPNGRNYVNQNYKNKSLYE